MFEFLDGKQKALTFIGKEDEAFECNEKIKQEFGRLASTTSTTLDDKQQQSHAPSGLWDHLKHQCV